MKKMDMYSKSKLKELIDNADVAMVVTDKAAGVVGSTPNVCSMLSMLVRQLRFECKIPLAIIEEAFKLGTCSEKEVLNEARSALQKEINKSKELSEVLNKLEEIVDKL